MSQTVDDEQILRLWHQVTGGKPESKRNVWMYLLGRSDGAAEFLRQRFDALRKSGRLKPKGTYRFGDDKYIVANPEPSEEAS